MNAEHIVKPAGKSLGTRKKHTYLDHDGAGNFVAKFDKLTLMAEEFMMPPQRIVDVGKEHT